MRTFVPALLLALLWMLLTGGASLASLGVGLLVGFALLRWFSPRVDRRGRGRPISMGKILRKVPAAFLFVLFLIGELVVSSLRVALDVLTPRPNRQPALVIVQLDLESDAEIAVLANLVSLTPGSIALDVSEDRRELLVHAMFAPDPESLRRTIKRGYERRVKELLS